MSRFVNEERPTLGLQRTATAAAEAGQVGRQENL